MIVKEVSRKNTSKSKLKAAIQDRLQKWKEDFKNLLGNPPEMTEIIHGQLNIKLGHFTEDELEIVLKNN